MRKSDKQGWNVSREINVLYAVIDTNVLVSALWTHNEDAATKQVLNLLLTQDIVPLYNDEIIEEYNLVLNRPKFSFNEEDVRNLIAHIIVVGINTDRTPFDGIMLDESDRVFYEVSLTVEDSFLVTGNLRHYPYESKIVTPAEFMALYLAE